MERVAATRICREELNKHGLNTWTVRLNNDANSHFLGLCSYRDKAIILSSHHIDIHPDPDVVNTIKHEVAHALCPGHGHDEVWEAKAREIGCDNTFPCSNLTLSPHIIDAIRSGATVEVTFDEQVIRTPKYTITRIQDKCEVCGKVAKEVSSKVIPSPVEDAPDMKYITLECGHIIFKKIPKGTAFWKFQMGGDESCKHEWDKNNCVLCNRKRPYAFQLEGMKFGEAGLATQKGVLIADEMGLGKTIQAGGIVKFHPEYWPCLWVVKAGLKYQTSSFILWWMGDDHLPQIVNTSKDWLIPGLKHYIIGYDMLVQKTRTIKGKNGAPDKVVTSGFDISQFDRVGIKCVILDECQQIKNVDSGRTQMVRRVVHSQNRKVIGLSGTPWNNRGSELYPILNMIDPIKFPSEQRFKDTWVSTYWAGSYQKEGGIRHPERFREHTKDLIIRRERKEVMPELPLVNRTKLNVVMTAQEEEVYDEAVQEFVEWFESQGDVTGMAIIAAMSRMRHLVAQAKIPTTLEYVSEFVEDTDRKLVVFAHHQDVQQMLHYEIYEKYGRKLLEDGKPNPDYIPVFKVFAEDNPAQRFETQEQFNAAPRAILVGSQLGMGEGGNLQTCCDCVMHERQWNPGKEEQCEGRFIRIGSTATSVNAVYAHMDGLTAIDAQLDGIVEGKRRRFSQWTGRESEKWNEDSIMKELATAIVNAHNAKKNRKKAS